MRYSRISIKSKEKMKKCKDPNGFHPTDRTLSSNKDSGQPEKSRKLCIHVQIG